ncbi:MAG: hypothetical protein GY853_09885 [PVC group bacterium]|nr:hypothetical protein [PVC group bacterium]
MGLKLGKSSFSNGDASSILSGVAAYNIPRKHSTEEKLVNSPLSYDYVNDKLVSTVSLELPGDSLDVGDVLTLSEGTSTLVLTESVDDTHGAVITSEWTAAGSSAPNCFELGVETTLDKQTTDTTNITTNPLSFNFNATADSQVNALTFRTFATMSNVRAKVTHNSSNVIVKYIPSKVAWDTGTGGLSLILGDNFFDFISVGADTPGNFKFGVSPFRLIYNDQYDIEIAADAMALKGNASEFPYLVSNIQVGTNKDLALANDSNRAQSTGLLAGGVISQASSTTVDWESGAGVIADFTNPEIPIITDVEWDAVSGIVPTNLSTDGLTLFGYDSTGSVVQKLSTAVSILDAHDTIWFGSATHLSSGIVSVSTSPGNIGYNGVASFSDFINLIVGPANIDGNVYGANGSNMNIDVSGGNAYMMGSNFRTNTKIPDIVPLESKSTVSFQKVYRSAGAGLNVIYDGVATTTIDPSSYDDGSGTLATTQTGYWTIQRIFRDREGDTIVAYGQQEFATKSGALDALGSEAFTEKAPLPFWLYRCSLLVQEGASDLSDTDEAEFYAQSSFRIAGAQSATASIPGITNPGGSDGAIQYNSSNTFGGDGNHSYDDTLKIVSLQAPAAGSATYEFYNSTPAIKGTIKYAETADTFSINSLNTLGILTLQDKIFIHKGTIDGRIDIEAVTASGKAQLTLSQAGGGTGLSFTHNDLGDNSEIIGEVGNLIIGTDGSDTYINISPDGATGFKKVPDANYVFDVYAAGSDIVGLYSDKGVTLETGTYGNAASTNFILNKGDAGTNQSEFVMFNDNNATELARYFRMGYADQIATQGGLNISDQNNFVGIGTRTDPDSPLHVYQNDTETGDECGITIEQDGTGDAVLQWLLSGGQRWVAGIANAGGDAFEIASSINLGSNTRFLINTTGEVKITDSLMIGSESNPVSPLHIYEDTTATGTGAGLTIEQDGTGDAVAQFLLTGGVRYKVGIDNSDSDLFKIDTANLTSDAPIQIDSAGILGIHKAPTTGYSIDIFGSSSHKVRLFSEYGIEFSIGPYGTDGMDFIFNKGDLASGYSEFVMYNDYNGTELARNFRMGFTDDIATSGGLTIWKERNNVAVGTYSTPDSVFTVYEDTTETGDQAGITIIQDGTGDSVLQYLLNGGQRWVTGIMNAGGDAYAISSSLNLGSNTRFIINTTGEVKITDSLIIGSSANPTSLLHLYENTTETGAAAGLTIEQDSTGDAVLHYVLSGIQTISTGVDYSGGGHYRISGNADLGTDAILTATLAGQVAVNKDTPSSILHLYEDTTLTGSSVGLTIEQDGTGDALAQWYLTGGARYLAGIDNSISDLFKIEYGGFLSEDAAIQIDANNHVGVKTAPDSIFHVYQDDAVTGTSGGITIEQDGGGDAMLQFLLTGGTRWVMGIDNDDSDRFKINLGNSMATQDNFILDETNGLDLHISNSSTTNWALRAGIEMHNHNTADNTYTSLVHRGATQHAAGMLFKNDDYSADYAHIVFGARDANGFEENALTLKPAHIEIVNSTNTPYGGRGKIENLLTYSEQIDNAIWQTLGSNPPVVAADDAVAPNGETTADKVTVSGGAGYLRHNVTLVEDDIYTLSFWAKNVSGDKTIQLALELTDYTSIETTSMWKRYSVQLTANSENYLVFRTVGSAYHLWGVQLHAGTDETPYTKTEATAFDTATYGETVNGDLVVSGSVSGSGGQTYATKPPEVVEVWSLDDMPRVGGTGDVIPEYKLYRFMQEIDWGTTRLKLENDAYALFEGADVFVTSQTYSGTDPWIYGEGTIRCVGNGMTWKMTGDNATMFDITSGGWGMDYSTLMTTGDNCSLGTITAPSVTDPLLGARFISTRSLFQGFKTGLTLVQPGNIHIDISFFYDSSDAVGPMLSVIGMGKAGVIESTEVTMSSATSDFLYISPITEAPVTCMNVTLADEQSFFADGDTGDITLFADASVSSESVTSVSDNSGVARFNFSAPPTLFVGQEVTMTSFTNYDNGTFTITATGAGYYETEVAYNIADTGGSFTSDSVTVTSATHGLSELDAVLICCTKEYNHGSTIYNVQTNTFQVNTEWHTAETTGEWNDGSLDHTSKYVNSFNNGAQQNSNPAPSFNVADNATTTSTTTSWGAIAFGTTGSALVVGASNENFVLLDDVTGSIRYEGLDPITIKMNPSISMLKSGGGVEHQFRLFKTTGTPAFDPHTIKRTISTSTGAASLNCSAYLNPGDEFRLEVKATATGSTITISDFSL